MHKHAYNMHTYFEKYSNTQTQIHERAHRYKFTNTVKQIDTHVILYLLQKCIKGAFEERKKRIKRKEKRKITNAHEDESYKY